jgi:putative peptidoglycan lipid II flippase
LVNFLTSINKNYYIAIVSLISVLLNILLNFILINYYGVYGISVATSSVVFVRYLFLMFFTIKQRNMSFKKIEVI